MHPRTCRICLQPKSEISFEGKCETKLTTVYLTFLEAYNECTRLKAQAHDALPQYLCLACGNELQQFYGFLQRAKVSDGKLRELCGNVRKTRATSRALVAQEAQLEEATALQGYTQPIAEMKDPLEETDDEIEEPDLAFHWPESSEHGAPLASCFSDYDEEDNKPLMHLVNNVQTTEVAVEPARKDSLDKDVAAPHGTVDKDEKDEEYNLTETQTDSALSAQEQIFPQGRHKCHTCGKLYFTPTGLQAHLEVHLAKNAAHATKKKRMRGPNKKKQKPNVIQTESVETPMAAVPKTELIVNDDVVEAATSGKKEQRTRKPKLPKPKKMFPCQVCGKHMISASKLRYHMVMHTGEKDYLCAMCPKAYSTIYALKHHIKTHTGDRPYECRFCGDRFLRPTTLKSHIRRHTGERPYGCDICGKRFIQHSSMTTHIKLNHMAKTIPCPHCDKKYARQTDLNTHLLSHTGDKPFSCKLCPSRFIRQANLNKHMNQHHSGERERCSELKTTKSAKKASAKQAAASGTQQQQQLPVVGSNDICSAAVFAADFQLGTKTNSNPAMSVNNRNNEEQSSQNSAMDCLGQDANDAVMSAIYTVDTFIEDDPIQQRTFGNLSLTKDAIATNTLPSNEELFATATPDITHNEDKDLEHWKWQHDV